MKRTVHPEMHALIDRHFSGRISPGEERSMREHLPVCNSCHRYYERRVALAALDPIALNEDDRLAIGLGLERQRPGVGWTGVLMMAGSVVAVVLLGLALLPRGSQPPFVARGEETKPAGVALLVYQVTAGKPPSLAGDEIRFDDELAFTYRNAAAKKHLLVFGIDDHANVYWYHPAWPRAGDNPRAIPIEAGDGLHELREAVRHPIKGRMLRIVGLFTDRALSVRSVEAWLAQTRGLPAPLPGTLQTSTSFTVRHEGGGR